MAVLRKDEKDEIGNKKSELGELFGTSILKSIGQDKDRTSGRCGKQTRGLPHRGRLCVSFRNRRVSKPLCHPVPRGITQNGTSRDPFSTTHCLKKRKGGYICRNYQSSMLETTTKTLTAECHQFKKTQNISLRPVITHNKKNPKIKPPTPSNLPRHATNKRLAKIMRAASEQTRNNSGNTDARCYPPIPGGRGPV